jgi:ribose-phosphate pyrophosphokinase
MRPPPIDISKVKSFNFPGGELHVQLDEEDLSRGEVDIRFDWMETKDIVKLLLVAHTLKINRVNINTLHIPYVPFSPQDRVNQPYECFSLRWFAELINGIGAKKVIVIDAHSDVAPALINNCLVIPQHEIFSPYFFVNTDKRSRGDFVLVSPDGGALKKIYKLQACVGPCDVLECSKRRNTKNGKLTDVHINNWKDEYVGKELIIVDDICWGGKTFVDICDAIRAKSMYNKYTLMVSHGFFTLGLDVLRIFDEIYTSKGRVK